MPSADARPMSSTVLRTRFAQGATHAGPEQRVDDNGGLVDALSEHRHVARYRVCRIRIPASRAIRSQFRAE
jgi:hypothetical protein